MTVIIYGDFNCPYPYLASQRAGLLSRSGTAAVDWRAVEHDRGLPLTGSRPDRDRAAWDRELAGVICMAGSGSRRTSFGHGRAGARSRRLLWRR